MNFVQTYFQKRTNNSVANLDYELAEQFMNADFKFVERDLDKNGQYDGILIGKKFFHLEGIFLFLTDRTLSHPQVPYRHEDRGGKFGNILKEMGFSNRKVIWQPSDLFDLDGYLDGVRISNKNQYTLGTNFTPPTDKFTNTITTVNATGSFESNAITAPSSTSSMGAIITYQDNAGTNALNTDIVLKLSADGGSNYSTATLTAMPDFSSGIKMAKVNDLSVTAGTSLKYKIEFANQASGSKEARIRGVSLQY